ncbi:MAG: ribbon-helix-helix protein, CopG family [Tildeniella nuda ZEHNDER 1965/U140]|nr:ribbon-helix-helix protein, CopG family [Tildeniella nuda ZEHNDER 1965/U140]
MATTEQRKVEHLNVRLPLSEMAILRNYCKANQRSQSDVIREFIRSLSAAVSPSNNLPPSS